MWTDHLTEKGSISGESYQLAPKQGIRAVRRERRVALGASFSKSDHLCSCLLQYKVSSQLTKHAGFRENIHNVK